MNKGVVGPRGAAAEAERRADVKTCGLCAVRKGPKLVLRVRWERQVRCVRIRPPAAVWEAELEGQWAGLSDGGGLRAVELG